MSSNDHHERSSSAAKRSRRNLSPVWEHIEKNFELNKCICRVDGCNRTWGYDHSTGKLAIHLLNDHSIKIKLDDDDYTNDQRDSDADSDSVTSKNNLNSKSKSNVPIVQTSHPHHSQRHSDKHQQFLSALVVVFIVSAMMPFNVCNNQAFLNLLKALDPRFVCPERNTVASDINDLYADQSKKLKDYLSKLKSKVSLTTDGWKSTAGEPYIVVTCHLIDNFKVVSFVLDFVYFPHPHDAFCIAELLKEVSFILDF